MIFSVHKKIRPERKTAKTHLCGTFYTCIKCFHSFILKNIIVLSFMLSLSLFLTFFFWDCYSGILVLLLLSSNYNNLFSFKIFRDFRRGRWPCFNLLIAPACHVSETLTWPLFFSIGVPFAFQQVSILSETDVILAFWGGWQNIVCYIFLPFLFSSSIIYLLLWNLKFEFQNKIFLVNIKSYYWDKNDEGSIKSGPSTKA